MIATSSTRFALQWACLLACLTSLITPSARGQFGPPTVEVTSLASQTLVHAGDQVVVAVVFDHSPGWHVHTNDPKPPKEWGFDAIATVITPQESPSLRFGPIQWPTPATVHIDLSGSGKPLPYDVFEGRAIAFVPVIISPQAPLGDLPVTLKLRYQACDDSVCVMPVNTEQTVTFQVVGPEVSTVGTPPDPATFGDFDRSVFGELLKGAVAARESVDFDLFGSKITLRGDHPFFLVLLLLAAALGGLILNLTPCVIPVIPIKIMSLSAAAGNRARCFYLGIITSLGIIAFWLTIGGAIAFIGSFKQVNQLFQFPPFTIGVGVFVGIMALSMLGVFTIQVPQWVYRFMPAASPKAAGAAGGSTPGTFLFGIFTAVLSTPCTAPFMGTAAAWGAKQPPSLTLSTFAAIGVGMALPYALLSAFPAGISRIPRSGPASNLVKQVMGLLMVGVAIFFIGSGVDPLVRLPIDPPIRWFWWLVALTILTAMGLLLVKTFSITRSAGKRAFWSLFSVVFAAAGIYMAVHFTDRGPISWVAYTPERLAEASAQKKVVVMDFTAEWCLNCKALEATVLHRHEIVALLASPDVIPMRVDLTGNNVAGNDKLKSLNWVGIPLLAISGPGAPTPQLFDTYTPQVVQDAVARARGGATSGGTPLPGPTALPPRTLSDANPSGR